MHVQVQLQLITVLQAPPITPPHYIITLTSLCSTPSKISETIVDDLVSSLTSLSLKLLPVPALVGVAVGGVRGGAMADVIAEKMASSECSLSKM